jgi:hypothetical protein
VPLQEIELAGSLETLQGKLMVQLWELALVKQLANLWEIALVILWAALLDCQQVTELGDSLVTAQGIRWVHWLGCGQAIEMEPVSVPQRVTGSVGLLVINWVTALETLSAPLLAKLSETLSAHGLVTKLVDQ